MEVFVLVKIEWRENRVAEFQIVAKEIERLCKTYQNKCRTDECPLYLEDLCYAQTMSHIHDYETGELESVVMRWSEEHPAPEYPYMIDVLYDVFNMPKGLNVSNAGIWEWLNTIRISEDVAEKLGIEPKEE